MLAGEAAGVIFDMDGVVTDTASVHAAAWKRMFDAFLEARSEASDVPVVPFDIESDYRRFVDGKPRNDGVRSFLASRGISVPEGGPEDPPDAATVQGLGLRKNRYFLEGLHEVGPRPYPTTVELVHALAVEGLPSAVISSSRNAKEVLEAAGLGRLFDVRVDGVVAADLGLAGKPHPAVFREAARRMGVAVPRAVVVEDALAGVQAGRDGGFCQVIGVDRTGDPEALRQAGADTVVTDLEELELPDRTWAGRRIDGLPSALDHVGEIEVRLAARQPALFLDYDGTLTPIVDDPDRAILPESAREAIRRLAALAPLAIVSGRDLAEVRRFVGIEGIWYAGSHGFDIVSPMGERHERIPEALPTLDSAERDLRPRLDPIPGARLERKRYAITAHYRQVAGDRIRDVEDAVAATAATHPGLRPTGGKKILELRPDIAWDKGRAIRWLLDTQGLDRRGVLPLYVGDDETDEDGFRAIGRPGIGIVVRGESDDRPTRALFALDRPAEVPVLLDLLREVIGRPLDRRRAGGSRDA